MLEIRHLKTLMALRETGSLVEAAERVCLTQSALSHQLKELESRFGTPLFVRKSRPLRFTEAGKKLLSLADEIMPMVNNTLRELDQLIYGDSGRLFMAIECHSCFNWLMPTIDTFRGHWPAVELDFSAGFMFEPLPALAQGEVDLVVTSDPQVISGLSYLPLFRYETLVAMPNTHPLVSKDYIEPKDLSGETLITYPVEHHRLDIFSRFLTPAKVQPASIRTAELTLMMVQLVVSGRGLCALPNWALSDFVETGMVVGKPAGKRGVWPTLYAAVRTDDMSLPYIKDFLDRAREQCFKTLQGIKSTDGEVLSY